jgi:nitroimidazol reductase NimA-like FMN-containing flavoprotein (pyridoxamine 5'-phosphate oxidase superfamily)
MAATSKRVVFEVLDDAEARAFLARNHVGRLAYTFHDQVDIVPINYTMDDQWILGRTSVGAKLSRLAHHPWCAFEVDEVWSPFAWTSVVVKGTFYLLDPESGSPDVYARAQKATRSLTPDAFTPDDPVPSRSILYGIHINEISGRAARTPARQKA